ncbi:MAG: hydantoinase/oxoprolinase family protein [Solirubrobacteraceae bacterium]
MLLGVDVGGTFTDAVLAGPDGVVTAKAPSTPADQSEGVLSAVRGVLAAAGRTAEDVETFSHGMTVATNALLEGRAARTALVATAGFEDVVALGRQARAELYRLCAARPDPLVPPERRFGAPERTGPGGVLRALSAKAARRLAEEVAAAEPEAVAVVLLHSYRHPEHELAVGRALREMLPGVQVSLSHEVVGTFREYERAATTEIDAGLSPLLRPYLRRLRESAAAEHLPEPAIMQSNGGLIGAADAAEHAAWTVLSGPAAGAAGAAHAARAAGVEDVLCFDMGGTSCDVCVVQGGRVRETAGREVGGRPLALPMLDVHTVGAGGGSIGWRDAGGALRVGPHSAGADPGPACYGRGGEKPTVTDANLLLGLLPAGGGFAGGIRLDEAAARGAIGPLARELGLGELSCAEGIVRVANAEMVRALRVMTVERGIDPRRFALLACGGAGGLHACAIADELGVQTVLFPRASGVLAALGLVASPSRRDVQRSLLLRGGDLTNEALREAAAELTQQARDELGTPAAEVRVEGEVRYRGQAFELTIPVDDESSPADLRAAFEEAHEERYSYRDSEQEIELVTLRATATGATPDVTLAGAQDGATAPSAERRAHFAGTAVTAAVWRGEIAPGTRVAGPAVCELPETTLAIPPGWAGSADPNGTLRLEVG